MEAPYTSYELGNSFGVIHNKDYGQSSKLADISTRDTGLDRVPGNEISRDGGRRTR